MNGSFYFSCIKSRTALGLWIVGCVNHCNIAILILLVSGTGHEISTHETDLIAWEQTEIFLRRLFHEIFSLDVKLFRKWNFSLAQLFILQVIRNAQHLNLSFWIVVDH